MTVMLALPLAVLTIAAAPVPTPIGIGPKFRLPAASPAVARAAPVGRLACLRSDPARERAHIELFANRRVLLLPPGIGMAPPLRRHGADVLSARCSYPLRTTDPTGVVEYVPSARPTLADLLRGLGSAALRAPACGLPRATGRRGRGMGRRPPRRGDVGAIPLTRHAEIVVELGGYVPPHTSFRFPPRP